MAKRPVLTDVSSGFLSAETINNNNTQIETAFDNTISRDGSTPNTMGADLDLNSNDLLNVGVTNTTTLVLNGTTITPSTTVGTAATPIADGLMSKEDKAKLNGLDVLFYNTKAELQAAEVEANTTDILYLGGYLTLGDNGGGLYVRSVSEPSHAGKIQSLDGAWWELKPINGILVPEQFGAVGDDSTNDQAAMQIAVTTAATLKCKLVCKGIYRIGAGGIYTPSNTHIEWVSNSIWKQTGVGLNGAFITNVSSTPSERIVTNITLVNPRLDASLYNFSVNCNGIAYAQGASNVRVLGCADISNYIFAFTGGGLGGKAVGGEFGVQHMYVQHVKAYNCGYGFYMGAATGNAASGEPASAHKVIVGTVDAELCEAATGVFGYDTSGDPTGSLETEWVHISSVHAKNCGHAQTFEISDKGKGGVLVFGEARGIRIDTVIVHNDTTYPNTSPGYPAGGGPETSAGLSGDVGAVFYGWGSPISVGYVEVHGNFDRLIALQRASAYGDDAGPGSRPLNNFRFHIQNLRYLTGTAGLIFDLDDDAAQQVQAGELTGSAFVEIGSSASISSQFVSSSASGLNEFQLTVRQQDTDLTPDPSRTVTAALSSWVSGQNDMTQHVAGQIYAVSLADDAATSFKPAMSRMPLRVWTPGVVFDDIWINVVTPACRQLLQFTNGSTDLSDLVEVTTGVLSGTSGTDGKITISTHTDGKVYVENRIGAATTVYFGS